MQWVVVVLPGAGQRIYADDLTGGCTQELNRSPTTVPGTNKTSVCNAYGKGNCSVGVTLQCNMAFGDKVTICAASTNMK